MQGVQTGRLLNISRESGFDMYRITLSFILSWFMLLMYAPSIIALDNTEAPECIKGTVAKITESELYLLNTSFPDEALGTRDVMVILDKDTQYYDGTKKVDRSNIERDNLVLVHCIMVGKNRQAKIVRVIGGKKQ